MADSLRERIRRESTAALKAGDRVRLGALRMLSAAVVNREKEILHELSDEEVREVAAKEMKKRVESIEAFEAGGRTELADKERAERDAIEPYAPERLPDELVNEIIDQAFSATGASSLRDMGAVMSFVMGRVKGRADGAEVQRKVRARLGG